jgi:hypothetical protein
MAIADWETDADGQLVLWPVIGWDLAAGNMQALVRLNYARSQEEFEAGGIGFQCHMTPVQVRELGQALLRQADILDERLFGTKQ